MTNLSSAQLDSILKSRDITLPTSVHLLKAMVFPVVLYGCKSQAIKKAEEDGRGIRWEDHFLPHKFIERTFEC